MVTNGLGSEGWEIGDEIGRGTFAIVHEAYCKRTGWVVAAKRVRSMKDLPLLRREFSLMSRIHHDRVLKVHGQFLDESGGEWIIMERAAGTLAAAVKAQNGWTQAVVTRRGLELFAALHKIHREDIVHRDINPDNVLVTCWKGGCEPSIKISDFGIGKLVDDKHDGRAYTDIGRTYDRAPEWLLEGNITAQSDIYQAGLCMYFMFTGQAAIGEADGNPVIAISKGLAFQRALGLPTVLGKIISKSLRRIEDGRYARAIDVYNDLLAFLIGSPGRLLDEPCNPNVDS